MAEFNLEKMARKVAEEAIADLASKDIVEVVRCRDCKNWEDSWQPESAEEGRHYCFMIDGFPEGNFYCADGERK